VQISDMFHIPHGYRPYDIR